MSYSVYKEYRLSLVAIDKIEYKLSKTLDLDTLFIEAEPLPTL